MRPKLIRMIFHLSILRFIITIVVIIRIKGGQC